MTEGQRALRAAVRARGLTIEAAGAMVGVDYRTMWRWMNGEVRPDIESVERIEREFGVGYRLWLSDVGDNMARVPMTETPPK